MVRPIRIEFPGAIYHVLQRGFRRERIFGEEKTKHEYMEYLHQCTERFNVDVYAWCIMDNHVHLLLSTRQANLSRFMHSVNASFANSRQRMLPLLIVVNDFVHLTVQFLQDDTKHYWLIRMPGCFKFLYIFI